MKSSREYIGNFFDNAPTLHNNRTPRYSNPRKAEISKENNISNNKPFLESDSKKSKPHRVGGKS